MKRLKELPYNGEFRTEVSSSSYSGAALLTMMWLPSLLVARCFAFLYVTTIILQAFIQTACVQYCDLLYRMCMEMQMSRAPLHEDTF